MSAFALVLALALGPAQDSSASRKLTAAPDRRVDLDLQHYYKASEVGLWLGTAASAYPEFLRLESMGKSAHGEELWVLSVAESAAGDPATRPSMMVVGALGRDDLFGTELALATILELVQNHARDEQVGSLLRRATLYFVPSANPDLRTRVFAELEGQPVAPPSAGEVELERNFPIGWDPLRWERAGAYPLSTPEARALAEFMLGHPNIAFVQRYGREREASAKPVELPASDREHSRALCASAGVRGIAESGPVTGAWLDFAYGQLGCLSFTLDSRGVAASEALPQVDALFQLARDAAPRTLRLASALPRLELGAPTIERLRGDQWQVRVSVKNSGATPTLTQLGRERFACGAPKLALEGGRVVAASISNQPVPRVAATLTLPELEASASCDVTFFVDAPEGSELTLSASAPRAGVAATKLVLR